MKKLLAIVLTAVLVLAFAAITMAEVKVTGEANFGLVLSPAELVSQFSDCKLVFDAAVNDAVSVNAAIKGAMGLDLDALDGSYATSFGFDTYSVSDKIGNGTLKLGYFGTNFNGTTDILPKVIKDLKGANNINYSTAIGDAMTVQIQYSYQTGDGFVPAAYLAGLKYNLGDTMAFEVGMESKNFDELNPTENLSGTAFNFTYTAGALKAYLNYESIGDLEMKDEIIGVLYTADSGLSARFEYDLVKDAADNSPMALRVGYTVNAITYQLDYCKVGDDSATAVKANVKF